MNVTIRSFTPDDYEAAVAIANAVFPGYNDTVENWRHSDNCHDPKCRLARWMAERDGVPVGFGGYWQSEWLYDPRKFFITVRVHPDHRRQGIGRALYDTVTDALREYDPNRILGFTREDDESSVRFLTDRGFAELMRDRESILDLATFDLASFNGDESVIERRGLRTATFPALAGDPCRDEKYYELDFTVGLDMPTTEEQTPPGLEQFRRQVIQSPDFLPDATLFALDGDRYVGVSALMGAPDDETLNNGTTGVLREYRGRGIATALKLRNIRWAKEKGCQRIRTWNEQGNRAMLGINERLGFEAQFGWVSFAKDLSVSANNDRPEEAKEVSK